MFAIFLASLSKTKNGHGTGPQGTDLSVDPYPWGKYKKKCNFHTAGVPKNDTVQLCTLEGWVASQSARHSQTQPPICTLPPFHEPARCKCAPSWCLQKRRGENLHRAVVCKNAAVNICTAAGAVCISFSAKNGLVLFYILGYIFPEIRKPIFPYLWPYF